MRIAGPLIAVVGLAMGGCGVETCDCGAGGQLFVELTSEVREGSVEVCFENRCAVGEIDHGDGTADEAEVRFGALGGLEAALEASTAEAVLVELTIFGADGEEIGHGTAAPTSATNCCGTYWTVTR